MNFTMNIPGLKDVIITKMEQVEDRVALHVALHVELEVQLLPGEDPARP